MANAEGRRRDWIERQREEEEMSTYPPEEGNQYEYKIVRANWGIFGKPMELKKLLDEESPAGWQMVEKFDNHRIRFKRPVSARERDGQLAPGVDPYRTQVGMPPLAFALLILAIVVGVVLVLALLGAGIVGALVAFNLRVQ
jgi:hypothetical protein